jgi:hypothetical protein
MACRSTEPYFRRRISPCLKKPQSEILRLKGRLRMTRLGRFSRSLTSQRAERTQGKVLRLKGGLRRTASSGFSAAVPRSLDASFLGCGMKSDAVARRNGLFARTKSSIRLPVAHESISPIDMNSGMVHNSSEVGSQKAEGRTRKAGGGRQEMQVPAHRFLNPVPQSRGAISKKCPFCQDMYEKKQVSRIAHDRTKNSSH